MLGGRRPSVSNGPGPDSIFADAQSAQQGDHRAPVAEGALKEVQADEGREKEPVGRMQVRQEHAEHDEKACNHPQISIDGHGIVSFATVLPKTGGSLLVRRHQKLYRKPT